MRIVAVFIGLVAAACSSSPSDPTTPDAGSTSPTACCVFPDGTTLGPQQCVEQWPDEPLGAWVGNDGAGNFSCVLDDGAPCLDATGATTACTCVTHDEDGGTLHGVMKLCSN